MDEFAVFWSSLFPWTRAALGLLTERYFSVSNYDPPWVASPDQPGAVVQGPRGFPMSAAAASITPRERHG